MSAIPYSNSSNAFAPLAAPGSVTPTHEQVHPARRRPSHLRVIEGGRSPRSMVKVYRRRRLLAAVILTAAVALAVLGIGQVIGLVAGTPTSAAGSQTSAVAAQSASAGSVIVVQQGDTLSSIARRLQPSGSTTKLVDKLSAAHGPGVLLAGDRLSLEGIE